MHDARSLHAPYAHSLRLLFSLRGTHIRNGEVVARNIESLTEIESMSLESLHSGVQMQLSATELAGVRFEPRDHLRASPFGAMTLCCDQVIDIQVLTPSELGSNEESSDTQNLTSHFRICDSITELHLLLNPRDQALAVERRPQLPKNWNNLSEIVIGLGDADNHDHRAHSETDNWRDVECRA
jgi:hypothetical protein